MDKKNNIWILIGIIAFILIAVNIGIFAVNQNPTSITRVMPSSVSPGSSFTVKYTAVGGSGNWGATIEDSVSGGCTPTNVRVAFISPQAYAPIIFKAPSSGSCTFHGDYEFGTGIRNMADKTITISANGNGGNGNGVPTPPNGNGVPPNGDEEVPSFDLNRVLFKLGDFEVTLLIILIIFGALFAYSLVKRR